MSSRYVVWESVMSKRNLEVKKLWNRYCITVSYEDYLKLITVKAGASSLEICLEDFATDVELWTDDENFGYVEFNLYDEDDIKPVWDDIRLIFDRYLR